MSSCLVIASLLLTAAGPPPTKRAATQPGARAPIGRPTTRPVTGRATTTQPTAATRPPNAESIRRLVLQLGAPEYRLRQAAQEKLADLGGTALPVLADFIDSPNDEIANRVAALIRRPSDPVLRVEIAVRLLATTDPDRMEPAVYMLFEDPIEDCDRFAARVRNAEGRRRAVFDAVAGQLAEWKKNTERFRKRRARLLREKPEAAAKELKMQKESKFYQAEAAYWQAVDAAETYGQPVRRLPPPTSRRSDD